MGQISIFHFITTKGTSLHDLASFEPYYISPVCPEVPREWIFTKFGAKVPFVDLMNAHKLCFNLFEGFDFTGG